MAVNLAASDVGVDDPCQGEMIDNKSAIGKA
jgi:hypothetical protein